jgi:hypothetical protein
VSIGPGFAGSASAWSTTLEVGSGPGFVATTRTS